MDLSKVDCITFDGIDWKDYPDFCDAYIDHAHYDGAEMTSEQLDELNGDSDFVYEQLMKYIF